MIKPSVNFKEQKNSYFAYNPLDVRSTARPVARPVMANWLKKARDCFWTVEEVNCSQDAFDFKYKLNDGERRFVKYILAFFAPADGLVNDNIAERFKREANLRDAEYFYNFQMAMEDIHADMYSVLLDTIIENSDEKARLIDSINTIPVVGKIASAINSCISSDEPFAARLLRMACIEGIVFQCCFCAIYWLKSRGLMPGLAQSNELISRDEHLHTIFGLHLYTEMLPEYKLGREEIKKIFTEMADLAKEFIADALPNGMAEMNIVLMNKYIENITDNLLVLCHEPALYNVKHEFTFMDKINLVNRTNFFDHRVSEYSKMVEVDDGSVLTDF